MASVRLVGSFGSVVRHGIRRPSAFGDVGLFWEREGGREEAKGGGRGGAGEEKSGGGGKEEEHRGRLEVDL